MTAGLNLEYPLARLRGADYNPRRIDADGMRRLKESLLALGCVKPIIARGEVIVAGHQRARGLRELGHETAPVYLLGQRANVYDEVRFNQLHNGTDLDAGCGPVTITEDVSGRSGYVTVPWRSIQGNTRSAGAVVRSEIMKLIVKHGEWGGAVVSQSGQVLHAAQYALACKILARPLLVYVIPAERERDAAEYLGASYGVYSYDSLPRETYVQTFAQLYRLRGKDKEQRSPTYEEHVIPWLAKHPGARVLDFGCGQGDYVRALRERGHDIQGLEFFRRVPGKDVIDVRAVNAMVDALIASLRERGRFDAVVCDYVLNSVDSQQAEEDVCRCLGAFCKPGGALFFSGRCKEFIESIARGTRAAHANLAARFVEFFDENGMTALYRKGRWFYQKFHSAKDIAALCARNGWEIERKTEQHVAWQVSTTNGRQTDRGAVLQSIAREFDMPLSSSGRRLGRSEDVAACLAPLL